MLSFSTQTNLRDMIPSADRATQYWVQLVRGEYLEIPGLRLTRSQVQRLWGFDAVLCDKVLGALIDARFLQQLPQGGFVRA